MCRDCGCETASKFARGKNQGLVKTETSSLPFIDLKFTKTDLTPPALPPTTKHLNLEEAVLAKNDSIAQKNRQWFHDNNIQVLNLISSPGTGKTLLLEKTVDLLKKMNSKGQPFKISILTGDQEKDFDAQRLKNKGADVQQINTLHSCHLDASMIQKELNKFVQPDIDLLIIENVGNLVCPAAFDLGETKKIALLSTTEGEDKPSKYPLLFHEASLILLTKIDLMPYLDWNLEKCIEHLRKVNSKAPILQVSAKTGEGLSSWIDFLLSMKSETTCV